MRKWNHYICPNCKGVTIARHDDEGVTPFLLRCRAHDTIGVGEVRGHVCEDFAQSTFFEGPQNDDQTPHVIFFRPNSFEAMEFISNQPERERSWLLDHYIKGGSLMKEAL